MAYLQYRLQYLCYFDAVVPCTCRIDALKAALSAHEDIGTIRGLFDSGKVPNDVRMDLWKV